jgi:type VI protein secretion system component VasK
MLRFGLYQGAKLDAQAERAYRNMLSETLLPHLARSGMTPGTLPENLQKDLSEHIRAAQAAGGKS